MPRTARYRDNRRLGRWRSRLSLSCRRRREAQKHFRRPSKGGSSSCAPIARTATRSTRSSESPLMIAPPFRTLHERYPVEASQESLAEGIVTGHPSMPEFRLDPGQVGDVIAYLNRSSTRRQPLRLDRFIDVRQGRAGVAACFLTTSECVRRAVCSAGGIYGSIASTNEIHDLRRRRLGGRACRARVSVDRDRGQGLHAGIRLSRLSVCRRERSRGVCDRQSLFRAQRPKRCRS